MGWEALYGSKDSGEGSLPTSIQLAIGGVPVG